MQMTKNKLSEIALWLIPFLFLIDDVLGLNGYQFTIAGKSIRILLFVLTVGILCLYSCYVLWKEKIPLASKKKDTVSLFRMLRPLDWIVFTFLAGNFLWATAVPLMVRGNMAFGLKDFSTVLVLVLYFPLVFLVRTGYLNFERLESAFYWCTVILAGWHGVMYVGDILYPGFYASYYDFIDIISFGTAVRSDVVFGFGIVRVIQVTSLFLLVGAFLALRKVLKGDNRHLLTLSLFIFAICVTYTKSIWFGFATGLFLYLVPAAFLEKDREMRKRCFALLSFVLCLTVILNFTVFGGTIFSRAFNTVRSEDSVFQLSQDLENMSTDDERYDEVQEELMDAQGTLYSNNLRAQQSQALLAKWNESIVFGHGYGAYAEDCIRNADFPYMYESTLPAMIMKLGMCGLLLWGAFVLAVTVIACRFFWKRNRTSLFLWLGLAVSYAMAVQTNPFLFTFTGFSILLYLLISLNEKKGNAEV